MPSAASTARPAVQVRIEPLATLKRARDQSGLCPPPKVQSDVARSLAWFWISVTVNSALPWLRPNFQKYGHPQ